MSLAWTYLITAHLGVEIIHEIRLCRCDGFRKLLVQCESGVKVDTIWRGRFSCPALKSALLHRPATRDRAAQVAELLSKPKPERIAEETLLEWVLFFFF